MGGGAETAALGELFAEMAPRLRRAVAASVRAPEWVIEECCQGAWLKLIQRVAEVRPDCRFAWLITVAVHDALRVMHRQAPLRSLDQLTGGEPRVPANGAAPHDATLQRQRLESLRALPPRQQRALWLAGAGLSYTEVAAAEGCTERTVERQLYLARQALREAA
jgi:RNA polymerase sigma factor (sigma-70 family)